MGVTHQDLYPAAHHIISNASCTTNCLEPRKPHNPRCNRSRTGPDDDGARLHRRPEPAGWPTQRLTACTGSRGQRRFDIHRGRQSDLSGAARTTSLLHDINDPSRVVLQVPAHHSSTSSSRASRAVTADELKGVHTHTQSAPHTTRSIWCVSCFVLLIVVRMRNKS
jgi:Glyceraldehyde-3-phosphate dehydrogenase/erythrose-4-phosphate dehydrogenase